MTNKLRELVTGKASKVPFCLIQTFYNAAVGRTDFWGVQLGDIRPVKKTERENTTPKAR